MKEKWFQSEPWSTTNSKRITSAGYGLFHLGGDTHKISLNGLEVSNGDEVLSNIKIGKGTYNLYKLTAAAVNRIKPNGTNIYSSVRVDYNIVDYNISSSKSVTVYINPYFANAISDKALANSYRKPFPGQNSRAAPEHEQRLCRMVYKGYSQHSMLPTQPETSIIKAIILMAVMFREGAVLTTEATTQVIKVTT